MVNQWLCIIFQASCGIMFGSCMGKMLPKKENRIPNGLKICCWFLLYLSMAMIRILPNHIQGVRIWTTPVFFAIAFVFVFCFYGDAMWKRCLAVLSLFMAQTLAEITGEFTRIILDIETFSMDYTQMDMVIGSCLCSMLAVFLMVFITTIWKKLFYHGKILKHVWFWIAFILMQLAPIMFYYKDMYGWDGQLYNGFYIVLFISYVAVLVVMMLLQGQSDKEEMKKQLEEVRYQMSLEQLHYQNIEERREAVEKIRRDYNNQLSSVLSLVHMNKFQEAENMLMEVLNKLEATKEYPYCSVPIINAVLSEKQKLCDENGISLETKIALSQSLSVSQMDLCSVFGNLMDNAIRACTKVTEKKPFISVSAGVLGDYLTIRCENVSAQEPGQQPEGTGYGFKILREIAKKYSGDFYTEYRNGIFTAQISLLMEND